ncbi:MAG: carboxypeptidase regulatory-like domain-containing protein [Gemmatimonadota bacterium]
MNDACPHMIAGGLLRTILLLLTVTAAWGGALTAQQSGRIAGQVVDQDSGRPLPTATVRVVEAGTGTLTDVNGRFRTPEIPAGSYTVEIELLGYATARREGVVVEAGGTAITNFAMTTQAIAVEGLTVEVERTTRRSSEASLLAMQQAAPAVSDGVSAEQISRSPDSDAGDAVARVTGVSVVDDKFVVVRGLGERYSTTLLNGAELASPEPAKKIVPMDLFAASLLESVVTSKTATPDKPGDFAGGAVEIKTKEFPEERVLELETSFGYNSLATFKTLPVLGRSGTDFLGLDGVGRQRPDVTDGELFLEGIRNRWIPSNTRVLPNMGFGVNYGNQLGEFERALGYVFSLDYGYSTSYTPDDLFLFVIDPDQGTAATGNVSRPATTTVNWGAVGNLALRLGATNTFTLKNLVTREAEEFSTFAEAFDPEFQAQLDPEVRRYQVRYVERTFAQSQLGGQHFLSWLGDSSIDWKLSYSRADRDEPENRSLNYVREGTEYAIQRSVANAFWFRFLDDRAYSAQLDWSIPVSLRRESDALIKFGGLGRLKSREFDAEKYDLRPALVPQDGLNALKLPPEALLAPENAGRNVVLGNINDQGLPYDADDDLYAAYLMLDLRPFERLRIVGGLRTEIWKLNVFAGGRESPAFEPTVRDQADLLWSTNLTFELTDRMNLRAAGYRTVSRPDPREVSDSQYSPVVGECVITGDPSLGRAVINNADLRWEWYPSPGELVSVSGFGKWFSDPIIQLVINESFTCVGRPLNAESATNLGVELEVRKNLGILAESLEPFTATVNFTFVDGDVKGDGVLIPFASLPLQDQSRFLVNASLGYDNADTGTNASLLYNYFDDRVRRYGVAAGNTGIRVPDVIEQGRSTLDAKVSQRFGESVKISLSAKNLTNAVVREYQDTAQLGPVTVGYAPLGVSFSLGVSYAY